MSLSTRRVIAASIILLAILVILVVLLLFIVVSFTSPRGVGFGAEVETGGGLRPGGGGLGEGAVEMGDTETVFRRGERAGSLTGYK